jgi:hypothetical protein
VAVEPLDEWMERFIPCVYGPLIYIIFFSVLKDLIYI